MSTRMNSDIKAQWVTALRSGQYLQGTGRLRCSTPERDRYCCLGVLCELAVQASAIPPAEFPDESDFDSYAYAGSKSYLPLRVQDWSGLFNFSGGYKVGRTQHFLSEDNDNGKTFDDIADIVEQCF